MKDEHDLVGWRDHVTGAGLRQVMYSEKCLLDFSSVRQVDGICDVSTLKFVIESAVNNEVTREMRRVTASLYIIEL